MTILTTAPILAQSGTDWKTEGNTADSSSFIGTTNQSCLQFRSNNIERMRISHDGNVGIGVDNPEERLDVDGDFQLHGDIIFSNYEDQQDTTLRFLMINGKGRTTNLSREMISAYMSFNDCFSIGESITLPGMGEIVAGSYATWGQNIDGIKAILHTGSECPAWVGIGTDLPMTKLDVRGDGRFLHGVNVGEEYTVNAGLYIENFLAPSAPYFDHLIMVKDENGDKLLQLNNDGLLKAREIKVDLETWPDYVFEKEYELMPLNEVKSFIEKNGHLPNVPSANEIEAEGVNLGDAAKTSMEKIEELTLYLIKINDKLEDQDEILEEQQKLLKQQQETIRLQKELIKALKNNKN